MNHGGTKNTEAKYFSVLSVSPWYVFAKAADSALSKRGFANRLEFVSGFPLGVLARLRDAIADREEHLQIFDGAAEIPIRFYDIGRLVVVVLGVVVANLLAVIRRLADEFDPLIRVERRHTLLGKVEVIRAVVEALFRFRVGADEAALLRGRFA